MDPNKDTLPEGGFLRRIGLFIRLVFGLLFDSKVSFLLKLLPIAAIIYLLIPDILTGPFDDLVILVVCWYLFVELVPDRIKHRHKQNLLEKLQISYQMDDQNNDEDRRISKRDRYH